MLVNYELRDLYNQSKLIVFEINSNNLITVITTVWKVGQFEGLSIKWKQNIAL